MTFVPILILLFAVSFGVAVGVLGLGLQWTWTRRLVTLFGFTVVLVALAAM